MAGATKALLAPLVFALLLSAGIVDAARPITSEGSASGSLMARDAHSRQLRFFFRRHYGCGFFGWFGWFGGCAPRYIPVIVQQPVVVEGPTPVAVADPAVVAGGDIRIRARDGGQVTVTGRRLNFFFGHGCWFWCYKKKFDYDYGYSHFWGRKLRGDEKGYGYSYCGFFCKIKSWFYGWFH